MGAARHHFEVIRRIVAFVLVAVMDNLVWLQEPTELVLSKNAMKRVQTLGVATRMRRVGATVLVAAAFAYGKDLEQFHLVVYRPKY